MSSVPDAPTAPEPPAGNNGIPAGSRTVAVLTNVRRPNAIEAAARFVAGLTEHGLVSLLPAYDIEQMGARVDGLSVSTLDTRHPIADCELAVVFGGDGTILRGSEWALNRDIPLLGVNLGHVGFLAEAEATEIDAVITGVVDRAWTIEKRSTAQITVRDRPLLEGGDVVWTSFAINECSVEKAAREKMIEVLIAIDDRPLSRWACDGVLVSTSTGSTAYAFSAGGPVMWPDVESLLVVPLSAHALFARSLVVGRDSKVTVRMLERDDNTGVIWADGRRSVNLTPGMEIEVVRGEHDLRMARLSPAPFTDRLVRKFDLVVDGWRGTAERRERRH
ncbi:NAD kinase [Granulicoccus phenolivorans]|uniref:NAD kinase n=1 Tax=Granulicoccus phenolivorans TaxID=266854 RepID=UPI000A59E3BB|nr:NAD kinase [Granulicoccus phenolivorans]